MNTVHDLPSNWREVMLKLYSVGASDTEVRAELAMTHRLWQQLKLTDPAFEEVIIYGQGLSKAWWMKQGRTNLDNRSFNAQLYKINMQNRFNWSDKTTANSEDDLEVDDEAAIDEQLKALAEAQHGSQPN